VKPAFVMPKSSAAADHNQSIPAPDEMIKPPKKRRRSRSAAKGSSGSKPAATTEPKPKTSTPKSKPADEPKANEDSGAKKKSRSRRAPRKAPKKAPAAIAPDAGEPVEPIAAQESEIEAETPEETSEGRSRRRRSGRGGRGRRNAAEQPEEATGIQSRDDDAAVIDQPAEEPQEKPRSRRDEKSSDEDRDEKPRRRRRRGGRGRRRRSEDAAETDQPQAESPDEPREERPSRRDRGEREDRKRQRGDRSSKEPVTFDPSAEFDPDVFAEHTYDKLPIRNSVLKGIHACGFNRPTHIQDQLIPIALEGKDVLGQAKTGTGKTAAFSIPALCMAERNVPFQTIILAPTRELAIQISAEITALGENTPIKNCAVYGGQPIPIQKKKLEQNPEIIVATPGRLMDMFEHKNLHFRNVRQVILDEVDRMLDIGFREDIRKILKSIKTEHQTIFVSATISEEIEKLSRQFMNDPQRLELTSSSLTVQLVDQHYVPCENWYKRRILLHLLRHEEPALTVVFCRTKATVDRVARYLREKDIDTQAIHGDMPQGKRNAVMKKLRGGDLSVLVASDLAARGLDVDDITHVINYDVPEDPEVYVHRIGRTARAGRRGHAWSLVLPDQGDLLTQIEQLTNVEITRLEYPDFDPGDPPAAVAEERREQQAKKEKAENMVSRLAQPSLPRKASDSDSRFPGGVVPTKLPPKMIRGKVNTTRGMKQMRDAEQKAKESE
jgi:ATP-dependent RNA helicase DeaD